MPFSIVPVAGDIFSSSRTQCDGAAFWLRTGFGTLSTGWRFGFLPAIQADNRRILQACGDDWQPVNLQAFPQGGGVFRLEPPCGDLQFLYIHANPNDQQGVPTEEVQRMTWDSLEALNRLGCKRVALNGIQGVDANGIHDQKVDRTHARLMINAVRTWGRDNQPSSLETVYLVDRQDGFSVQEEGDQELVAPETLVSVQPAANECEVADTRFRSWMMTVLGYPRNPAEWPLLLCEMLQAELARQQTISRPYAGRSLLVPRYDHDFRVVENPERRAVYGLYHTCLQELQGCLTLGNERIWLLSYEVPNQGHYRGRKADLVGMSSQGGLVVFECKLPGNSYGPVAALLEGLDYLACLTCRSNFVRVQDDFHVIRSRGPIPPGFEDIEPTIGTQHSVIVLAPHAYSPTQPDPDAGWCNLATTPWRSSSLRIGFAESELDTNGFFSTDVSWYG